MHPLRFPNSGIGAKVFMRKIGFKLPMMRLYRVELFYAFLLYFRSEGSEEEGRPVTHSQASNARKGSSRPRARSAAASPKGWQPPAGTAACSTAPAASPTTSGQGKRRRRIGGKRG
ncbi:hypothetical protein BHM03_00009609 [Ensete ventricosum]|nr:hypothetical protein BHM03_00009609 [Ensete ventricosum]